MSYTERYDRAATLLLSLGSGSSVGRVVECLTGREVRRLLTQVDTVPSISLSEVENVLFEFNELMVARTFVSRDTPRLVADFIRRSLGARQAAKVIAATAVDHRPAGELMVDLTRGDGETDRRQLRDALENKAFLPPRGSRVVREHACVQMLHNLNRFAGDEPEHFVGILRDMVDGGAEETFHRDLNGAQKAAALLLGVGPDAAASALRRLRGRETSALAMEMLCLGFVDSETREDVVLEFVEQLVVRNLLHEDDMERARDNLEWARSPRWLEDLEMELVDSESESEVENRRFSLEEDFREDFRDDFKDDFEDEGGGRFSRDEIARREMLEISIQAFRERPEGVVDVMRDWMLN